MKIAILSLLTAVSLVTSVSTAKSESLSIAATEWPPFYGADLEDDGFMTEIVTQSFSRAGHDSNVDFLP